MPNRLLREGILTSKRINSLSESAELFYRRLMSVVDDYGRCEADLDILLASCYPLRRERTAEDVAGFLAECSSGTHPLVLVYDSGRKTYLEIQDFNQRLRAQESRHPGPNSPSVSDTCQQTADIGQSFAAHARGRTRPTTTTTTTTTPTTEEGGPEETKSREVFPIMQASELGIEGWDELVEVAAKAGMSLDPDPASDLCQKVWRYRDWENRRKCIQGIVERVECGQYSLDEREYIPTLGNYVQKNQWRPSLRPKARGQPVNKKQATREQFDRLVMRDLEDADQQKIHSR